MVSTLLFPKEMAEQFNQQGYDFYALDLRKYGRSYLAHQDMFYVQNLNEYDAEISEALKLLRMKTMMPLY